MNADVVMAHQAFLVLPVWVISVVYGQFLAVVTAGKVVVAWAMAMELSLSSQFQFIVY